MTAPWLAAPDRDVDAMAAEAQGIEDKRRRSLIVGACNARASTIASSLQSAQHNSLSGQSNGVSTSS